MATLFLELFPTSTLPTMIPNKTSPHLGSRQLTHRSSDTHKAKPAQESPVPLPSYAQYAPAPTKRPAPDSDSDIETPAAKRQQAMIRDNDIGTSNPPGSGILARTPVPRNVDLNGRIMEVIDTTGERKYSEYWITCKV